MWGRTPKLAEDAMPAAEQPGGLKQAVRQARIESAERSSVVVDLRDAEVARLELLDEALNPLFAEIPPEVDLFDRGISHGNQARLWIDVVAHVAMGRDKRQYRFLQDTRYGRKVLAESTEIPKMVEAITHYVATRLVDRERALGESPVPSQGRQLDLRTLRRRRSWRWLRIALTGVLIGAAVLFAALWIVASQIPQ